MTFAGRKRYAGGCVSEPLTFLLIYRPPRPDFWATLTAEERANVEAHFYYLAELHERGIVQFAGRSDDSTFGIAIVVAPSLEDAERILRESPAYSRGMYTGEVRPYRLAAK